MNVEQMKEKVHEVLIEHKDFPKNQRSCKILNEKVNGLLKDFFKNDNVLFTDPYVPGAVVSGVEINTDGKHFYMRPIFQL